MPIMLATQVCQAPIVIRIENEIAGLKLRVQIYFRRTMLAALRGQHGPPRSAHARGRCRRSRGGVDPAPAQRVG